MTPNLPITGLPAAGDLDGSEPVPCVQDGVTCKTSTANIGGLLFGVPSFRAVPFWDGAKLAFDPGTTIPSTGVFQTEDVRAAKFITRSSNFVVIDQSSVVRGTELHANNGFTGSGAFTSFDIVDGIIVNAA